MTLKDASQMKEEQFFNTKTLHSADKLQTLTSQPQQADPMKQTTESFRQQSVLNLSSDGHRKKRRFKAPSLRKLQSMQTDAMYGFMENQGSLKRTEASPDISPNHEPQHQSL